MPVEQEHIRWTGLLEAARRICREDGPPQSRFEYTLIKGENDVRTGYGADEEKAVRGHALPCQPDPAQPMSRRPGITGSSRRRAEEIAGWLCNNGIADHRAQTVMGAT